MRLMPNSYRKLQIEATSSAGLSCAPSAALPHGRRAATQLRVHGVAEGDRIRLQGCPYVWVIKHLWHDGRAFVECLERAWVEQRLVRLLASEPRCRGEVTEPHR